MIGTELAVPDAATGAAFGDALIAGVGVGAMDALDQTSHRLYRQARRYIPDESHRTRYEAGYDLFRSLYLHLRDDFDRAAALVTSADLALA